MEQTQLTYSNPDWQAILDRWDNFSSSQLEGEVDALNVLIELDYQHSTLPKGVWELGSLRQLINTKRRSIYLWLARLKGKHTWDEEIEFIKSKNYVCEMCGSDDTPSIDHIIPISKGGSDGIENLQLLCVSCNSKKGNR